MFCLSVEMQIYPQSIMCFFSQFIEILFVVLQIHAIQEKASHVEMFS